MSSSKKKDSDPSLLGALLCGWGMACFGVLLGMLYLMAYPLEAYTSLSARDAQMENRESLEPIPGDNYYIQGPILRSRTWETKRKQLVEGGAGSLTISAGEINAWFSTHFRSAAAPAGEEAQGLAMTPDVPNMGITETNEIYLNLPAQIKGYGFDGNYVFSAKGHFGGGNAPSFKVDRFQIGGATVPLPNVIGKQFINALMKAYSQAEEYSVIRDAWDRVEAVEVSNGALILSLGTP